MNSSAMRSSSPVVTPGCTCSSMSAIVSATSSPARAIPSISCCDLRMIIAGSGSRNRNLFECLLDLGEDLVLGAVPVDRDEIVARAVVVDQRLRLTMVVLEPRADHLRRVVHAAFDLCAAGQPFERNRVRDLQREDDAERPSDLREQCVKRFRLHRRTRKAVEDEAVLGVRLSEAHADQLDHQLVGDEVAAIVNVLHALSELGARCHLGAQDLAARDVRDPVLRRDPLRLRAFTGPLRAQEQNVECYFKNPSYERIIICDSIWRIVASATPTTISTEVPPSAREVA